MTVELKWEGVADFGKALERIVGAADVATRGALDQSVVVARAATAAQFGSGDAPNRGSTGRLEQSVQGGEKRKVGFGEYEQQMGPAGLAYVRVTELGKKGKGFRKAKPFFAPGFAAAHSQFKDLFARAWAEAIDHGR